VTSATSAATAACSCAPDPSTLPVVLLTATIQDDSIDPALLTATVDYELGSWRTDALARHIVDWVADYALRHSEREHLSAGRLAEILRGAMRVTFGNGADRGVPGEILLHAICRQFFGSDTVINKVCFKTANNDTYKGFDAVHCVHNGHILELWLGEAKFYKDWQDALRSVVSELDAHLEKDYLRSEFALVASKIEDDHPHAEELRKLMHPNTSLDAAFDRIVVPILLTYDSPTTMSHNSTGDKYRSDLEAEVRLIWTKLKAKLSTTLPVSIKLFLIPLADKEALNQSLAAELSKWH
jgi:hypothetical protein